MGLQLTADNTKGNNVNTYHLTETVRVAAPERRNQNLTDVERQYLDSMEITAIGHDDRETYVSLGAHGAHGAYPSALSTTICMTLDDLDALRHAITRLLVKVQAETGTTTSAAVDIPAAAVGMVAGIPTPTVSVG